MKSINDAVLMDRHCIKWRLANTVIHSSTSLHQQALDAAHDADDFGLNCLLDELSVVVSDRMHDVLSSNCCWISGNQQSLPCGCTSRHVIQQAALLDAACNRLFLPVESFRDTVYQ